MPKITTPQGTTERFGYDALARRVERSAPSGLVERATYDLPDPFDPNNPNEPLAPTVITTTLDLGEPELEYSAVLDALGRTLSEERPGDGGRFIRVDRTFDERGRLAGETVPYFVGGTPAVREFYWDPLGRLQVLLETDPDTYAYFEYSTPWTTTRYSTSGETTVASTRFDGLGRRIEVTGYEPTAYTTRAQYDALDRLVLVQDPTIANPSLCALSGAQCADQVHETVIAYDTLGRRIRIEDPDSGDWLYEYFDSGLLRTQTNPRGQTLTRNYDSLGRLTTQTVGGPGSSGTGAYSATFGYGTSGPDRGLLASVTSAGTSYQYWRDAAGRVAWTRQWANVGSETLHFDNTYTFDPLDRIATRQFPDASLFTYVYDGTRLAEIQGPAEYRWPLRDAQYDAWGRPLTLELGRQVISSTPVSPATLAFEYDDPGERLSRITGTRHEPTGSGNPLVTSDQVFNFGLTFDGLGRLREQVVAGQGERSFDYDGLSRLKTATGPWARPNPSGPLEQTTWTLSYDALGNLRSLTSAPHTFTRAWSYEDPTRPRFLTRFDQNRYGTVPQAQTAAPDAAGAIATRDRTGLPDTFTWNAHNRLFSISGKGFEYHYDAFGQRTRTKVVVGETNTSVIYVGDDFEYDTQAQQANLHFFLAGRRIASFASFGDYYSAGSPPPWVWRFGLRAGPPVVVGMALLGLFGLAAVALGRRQPRWLTGAGVGFISGAFIALPYFVWAGGGGGGPSQLGSHGEIDGVYYLTDHLGSSRAVVNLNGELLEQRDYDPFGLELAPESDDYNLKHAFTGQPLHEVDADLEIPPLYQTGLYHYGARMYDPLWGRFISPDSYVPALDAEGLNRYSYARNNPTSLVDPTGNFFDFQWPSSFGLTGFTDSGLNSGLRGMTAAVGTSTLGISPDAYQRWLAQCEGCWPPDPYEPVLTYIAEDEDDSWFLQNMRHLRRTVNHIYGNVRNLRALTKIIAAPPRESQAEQPQRDPTVWPTKYGEVKDPFDPTGTLNPAREGQPHLGIDIVNPLGEPVFASDTGEVLDVYYNARGGNQIRVLDLDRGVEGYAHTRPIEGLSPGQKVRAGDVIGYSDASGRIRGPHLHYTYRPCPTCARVDPMTHLPR